MANRGGIGGPQVVTNLNGKGEVFNPLGFEEEIGPEGDYLT